MRRNVQRSIGVHSGSIESGSIDAAALQHLGSMFPFDRLTMSGQLDVLSHVISPRLFLIVSAILTSLHVYTYLNSGYAILFQGIKLE